MNLITVTINSAIDTTITSDSLADETISKIHSKTKDAAGKGLNVSKALAAFGIKSHAIVLCGTKNLQEFQKLLTNHNADVSYITHPGYCRENYTISAMGKIYKLDQVGEIIGDNIVSEIFIKIQELIVENDENFVLFAGSIPHGIDKNEFINMILQTKKSGTKILIDTSSLKSEDYTKINPFLIKPNIDEFNKLIGENIDKNNINAIANQLNQMIENNIAQNILLSLSENGLIFANKSQILTAQVPNVTVKSTTGAGDCTLAGFLYGIFQNKNTHDSLRFAAAFGTDSVSQLGTKPPNIDGVNSILEKIIVKK